MFDLATTRFHNMNFYEFGFEDETFMNISGTIPLVAFGIILNYLFFALLNFIAIKNAKIRTCRKIGIYATSKISFKYPSLKLLHEGYIDIAFGAILNMISLLENKNKLGPFFADFGNVLNSILAIASFCVVFLLPSHIYYVLSKNHGLLMQNDIKEKYWVYYEEFRWDRQKIASHFLVVMLIRRLSMIVALIFLDGHPLFQMMILIAISLLKTSINIHAKPAHTRCSNYLNVFNEIQIMAANNMNIVFMINHQNETVNMEMKNTLGWMVIVNIALNISVNIINSMVQMVIVNFYALKNVFFDI